MVSSAFQESKTVPGIESGFLNQKKTMIYLKMVGCMQGMSLKINTIRIYI